MLRTLMNGRLVRLVLLSAAAVALSGAPAYANTGRFHQWQRQDQGDQRQGCQVQGSRWNQNWTDCQQPQNQGAPQAPQPDPRIHDDGNSK